MLHVRFAILARHHAAHLSHLFHVRREPGAKVSQDQPRGSDGHGPQRKVEVDCADLAKEGDGGQAVADGLPRRLDSAEQGGVADDFLFAFGQVRDDEVPFCLC